MIENIPKNSITPESKSTGSNGVPITAVCASTATFNFSVRKFKAMVFWGGGVRKGVSWKNYVINKDQEWWKMENRDDDVMCLKIGVEDISISFQGSMEKKWAINWSLIFWPWNN